MNFKTRPVNREEFFKIIETLTTGYTTADGRKVRPNIPVAFAITLEGNLGIRISDIVELTLSDIKFEGGRYHLDIYEKKTDKHTLHPCLLHTVPSRIHCSSIHSLELKSLFSYFSQ